MSADYATQFRKQDLLVVRRYGPFAVYSVEPHRALLFVQEALMGVTEQLRYLEQRLVKDMTWADPIT